MGEQINVLSNTILRDTLIKVLIELCAELKYLFSLLDCAATSLSDSESEFAEGAGEVALERGGQRAIS